MKNCQSVVMDSRRIVSKDLGQFLAGFSFPNPDMAGERFSVVNVNFQEYAGDPMMLTNINVAVIKFRDDGNLDFENLIVGSTSQDALLPAQKAALRKYVRDELFGKEAGEKVWRNTPPAVKQTIY